MTEKRYKIIRFFATGKKRIIKKNVSLEIARLHCNSDLTRKPGKWFDGFTEI